MDGDAVIALYLTLCLGAACHDEAAPGFYASVQACTLAAQLVAAEYVDEHPDYVLTAFRCGPVEKET